MKAALFDINWLLFSGAFLLAEFFNVNQTYYWPVLVLAVWFGVAEGTQIAAGVEAGTSEKDHGTTASAFMWKWIKAGMKPGRFLMAWLFCGALCLRVAIVSAEYGGYLVPGGLPLLASQGPMWMVLLGVWLWLGYHLYSGGDYGNGKP